MDGRADAVPTTRNYTPDSPDLDERRGQPHRSAMARSRPGGTAFMITVIPQRQVSLLRSAAIITDRRGPVTAAVDPIFAFEKSRLFEGILRGKNRH